MWCPNGCGAVISERTVAHGCSGPPVDDPLAYPSEKAEADARQLAMLRHTLTERIKDREPRADHYRNCGRITEAAACDGAMSAYRDVLALLGPEEPTDMTGSEF